MSLPLEPPAAPGSADPHHPFDQAIALVSAGENRWRGATSAAYANMVGPFGGVTAAQALSGVLRHPSLLGTPVALTVNFAAALAPGEFEVVARPLRTNRSTQHWVVEMLQGGEPVLSATVFTALRRAGWSADDAPAPAAAAAHSVPRMGQRARVAWVDRYDMRFIDGALPTEWNGEPGAARSLLWLRDAPPRPLDFASLTAIADAFFPRIFLRRRKIVPIGTVSMTTYFHADAAQLAIVGDHHLLGEASATTFQRGYFEQNARLWSERGELLCGSHQIVYYKE